MLRPTASEVPLLLALQAAVGDILANRKAEVTLSHATEHNRRSYMSLDRTNVLEAASHAKCGLVSTEIAYSVGPWNVLKQPKCPSARSMMSNNSLVSFIMLLQHKKSRISRCLSGSGRPASLFHTLS